MVSREEHLALVEKYERLKKKAASQEETIRHLESLLGEKGRSQEELTRGFTSLIEEQTRQFQSTLEGLGRLFEGKQPGEKK
jgi:hypothetical protein